MNVNTNYVETFSLNKAIKRNMKRCPGEKKRRKPGFKRGNEQVRRMWQKVRAFSLTDTPCPVPAVKADPVLFCSYQSAQQLNV